MIANPAQMFERYKLGGRRAKSDLASLFLSRLPNPGASGQSSNQTFVYVQVQEWPPARQVPGAAYRQFVWNVEEWASLRAVRCRYFVPGAKWPHHASFGVLLAKPSMQHVSDWIAQNIPQAQKEVMLRRYIECALAYLSNANTLPLRATVENDIRPLLEIAPEVLPMQVRSEDPELIELFRQTMRRLEPLAPTIERLYSDEELAAY